MAMSVFGFNFFKTCIIPPRSVVEPKLNLKLGAKDRLNVQKSRSKGASYCALCLTYGDHDIQAVHVNKLFPNL